MLSRTTLWGALGFIILVLPCQAHPQDPQELVGPKASIDQLDWIAGHWKGDALGGQFEETWNPSKGGAMMGMFKQINDGKINFYELLTIVPKDDTLLLRLKHFKNDLVGWEEKEDSVEFPLVSISADEVKFDGLTFKKISSDEMHIVVLTKQKNGQEQKLKFECHRVRQSNPSNALKEISRVLEIDTVLSQLRNNLTETQSMETAIRAYVLGLDQIEFDKCPPGFAQAFKRHRNAWNDSIGFFNKNSEARGEMHAVIEWIRKTDKASAAELDRHMLPVMETWREVENQAKKHGFKLPTGQ